MKKIVLVTSNKAKARDIQKILGFPINVADIELEEIQETDLGKIAIHKINEAFEKIGSPVIIDDVGLYINAWNGFPGPLIKWILKAGEGNASMLLKMMEGEENRKAQVRLVAAYHDGKKAHIFFGEDKGEIAEEIRGENGFGWDPVFIPEGSTKTFAEMSFEEKNKDSHRRQALEKLKKFLEETKRV